MSSTRRVKDGQRRTQNGWASSVEFDNLRGLNGTAVALKAELIEDGRTRNLLYFLQGMSLKPGGVKRIARELMEMFPERIASPTMFKIGCKPGKRLAREEWNTIRHELSTEEDIEQAARQALASVDYENVNPDRTPKTSSATADNFISKCRERAESELDTHIERICCDPSMAVTTDKHEAAQYNRMARIILEDEEGIKWNGENANCPYFHDLLGALFEYQERCIASVRENFVETSIGKVVFEALDYALETERSALIEGNSGIGKTTALEAWCEMHAGQARLVKLKGITHRTGFFRECARALGVARGAGFSPGKVQMRVEQFLQRSKIMIVIDEGQYLFPPGNRVYSPPELINWLMTACYNERVPFAISATAEFKKRRAIIEKNTTWDSFQLRRRIRRDFELPQLPTKDDLLAVATKLLPGQSQSAIDYVVGYSLASKGFFQAITDAIDDARIIARRDGRDKITFADLMAAVRDWRSPSDNALQRVFEPLKTRRGRPPESSAAEEPQQLSGTERTVLNDDLRPVKTAFRTDISLVNT